MPWMNNAACSVPPRIRWRYCPAWKRAAITRLGGRAPLSRRDGTAGPLPPTTKLNIQRSTSKPIEPSRCRRSSLRSFGSLPRPKLIRNLIDRRDTLPADRYNKIMDEMVVFAIRLQEQAGLDVVSDGEWRRIHYLDEFLVRIGGHEPVRPFIHQGEKKFTMVVTKHMRGSDPLFVKDAEFVVKYADRCTKFALPPRSYSPSVNGTRSSVPTRT